MTAPENQLVKFGKWLGSSIYNILYETGGFFADLFGITTPKYGYIIREYEARQREAREQEMAAVNAGADTECPIQDLPGDDIPAIQEVQAQA